jgi:hypothetical protein
MIPLIRVPPLTQMKTQKGESESCSGQRLSSEGLYGREDATCSGNCAVVVDVDHGN